MLFVTQENAGVNSGKSIPFGGYRSSCARSFLTPNLGFYQCCKSQYGVSFNNKIGSLLKRKSEIALLRIPYCCKSQTGFSGHNGIKSLMDGNKGEGKTHFVKDESSKLRNRFSLRLCPRLRLLALRIKRASIKSIFDNFCWCCANIVNEVALFAARRGAETVEREDIVEAIERAVSGINDKKLRPSTISKELGKLFPWMPSLVGRNVRKQHNLQDPLSHQSLS
ncbi:ATP-dependent zinc metalloprotease FTSH-like protein [Quillaja saponaria]|uniref:ATP-dependent zinc metalloprotease FTSH-like protein n=1 Tax=Quillaja saponaria TaxID=32244 RepID=A0AAD7PXT9_QUISA|nr:ATP-dependent zinc metalloprotease FTSH-like protein [Quillaja saponaria]